MSERAPLATTTWGSGERTALLLHGQFGSAESWWQIGPQIAERGYRVVAVDLPGHGESPSDPTATIGSCTRQILDVCPSAEVAIGHSLGGVVLAHCAERFGARRTVFVDTPLRYESTGAPDEVRRRLTEMKTARTIEWLERNRPAWSDEDRRAEAAAAERCDVETSLSLMRSMSGFELRPLVDERTLVVAPRPSRYLSAEDLAGLERDGVAIREIDGADHTVWYGHREAFLAAIDAWL